MKILKMIFCRHEYEYIRTLYGDEINAHNGKRKEYRCVKWHFKSERSGGI